jgi:O-antigen/teichoic acid export membrane protein
MWRYLALGASTAEGIAIAAVALRRLGTAGYGAFALAATTVGLLGTIDFGLSLSIMRSIAKDTERFPHLERARARADVAAANSVYAVCGVTTLAVTGLIVLWLPLLTRSAEIGSGEDRLTIFLVGVSIAIFLGTAAFDGIPAGRRRFAVPAFAGTAGAVANVVFVVLTIGHLHLVALGAGQLIGTVVTRLIGGVWIRRQESWFRFVPAKPKRADLRRVALFTLPLLVLSVGGQLIAATDLLVIGALSTAAAVAFYRVGSLAPNQLIAVAYTGFDSIFPSLSASPSLEEQESTICFLTRVMSYGAGVAFAEVVMLRSDVVTLIVGHSDHLATTVLIVFSGIWIANIPVHGLALLLIARGRQRTFVPLVAAEAVANVALTIAFVYAFGPVGAAVATLVTIVISNDVLLPILIRHEFQFSPYRMIWRDGVPLIALGALLAVVGTAPFFGLHPGIARLAAAVPTATILGLLVGYWLLGNFGRSRLSAILRATGQSSSAGVATIGGSSA